MEAPSCDPVGAASPACGGHCKVAGVPQSWGEYWKCHASPMRLREEQAWTLPRAGMELLKYLRAMQASGTMPTAHQVEHCVDRYLKFLRLHRRREGEPLVALVAPPDVELIWQSHLIRPLKYIEHCNLSIWHVLDHTLEGVAARVGNRCEWEETEAALAAAPDPASTPMRKWLIDECTKDLKWFPDYEWFVNADPSAGDALSCEYVQSRVQEYHQFLWLARCVKKPLPNASGGGDDLCFDRNHLCPDISIDLYWHAHMMHPIAYRRHCEDVLTVRPLIVHDPWPDHHYQNSVPDPSGYGEDFAKSNEAWKTLYGTDTPSSHE